MIKPEAFTIEPGQEFKIDVWMTGSQQIRPGQPGVYQLYLKNRANVDIPFVFVDLSIPEVLGQEGRLVHLFIDPPSQVGALPPIEGFDWAGWNSAFVHGGRMHYPLLWVNLPPTPVPTTFGGSDPFPPEVDLEFEVRSLAEVSGYNVLAQVRAMSFEDYDNVLKTGESITVEDCVVFW